MRGERKSLEEKRRQILEYAGKRRGATLGNEGPEGLMQESEKVWGARKEKKLAKEERRKIPVVHDTAKGYGWRVVFCHLNLEV